MTRVDEINAQIAKLQAERESAMLAERANVLAKTKADMKLYGFKSSDFKGILKSRVTQSQVNEFLKRKEAEKSKPKSSKK